MKSRSLPARLQRRLALLALGLPKPLLRLLAGPPLVREGRTLDPQIQLLLRLQRIAGGKPWYEFPLPLARAQLETEAELLASISPTLQAIEELQLEGPAGAIAARLYRPLGLSGSAPALVYFHGGGFVLGNLDSHDTHCQQIAAAAGCVVVAVDYRLAPEHPFPCATEDAVAAFRAIVTRAATLDLDATRVAVGGDSAGGNLAAVVAQQTRRDRIRPCFQLLIYPTTDLTMSFPSIRTFASGFLLTKASMDQFLARYLPAGQDKRDPRGSPLYGEVTGLPPALVQTAGFDPLCDEGEAYARRMQEAGVDVRLKRYEGLVHGYVHLTDAIDAAREPLADLRSALQQAFAAPSPWQETMPAVAAR